MNITVTKETQLTISALIQVNDEFNPTATYTVDVVDDDTGTSVTFTGCYMHFDGERVYINLKSGTAYRSGVDKVEFT
ncbi:hypothetical protein KEU06_09750 [Pseudaminobacter sp. 19-2017]|uniref:Uncharacterized protein n=1 Tax=Pseudaminobacter soli (ex Zhang et al. 2022) TaxID=2831468 RepID=A0A942I807_9HYPH|nr:hypothetical protein [Pseudaminobacter soli]MBS3648890.1 hypothetical protein [Pseudaminobacter soli]